MAAFRSLCSDIETLLLDTIVRLSLSLSPSLSTTHSQLHRRLFSQSVSQSNDQSVRFKGSTMNSLGRNYRDHLRSVVVLVVFLRQKQGIRFLFLKNGMRPKIHRHHHTRSCKTSRSLPVCSSGRRCAPSAVDPNFSRVKRPDNLQ